ncbi:MAG TPA: MFS transporter, partial [Chloroflexota bacterium]
MSADSAETPAEPGVRAALRAVIWSSFLLRSGQSAASVIIGFYLALLARQGLPLVAILAALLLSSSYAVELVVAPIMGALSDRYGRKPFIIAGPLIGLAALQIYPISGLLPVLFLARALEGVSAATLTPATLGFLADNTSGTPEGRGRTMAYFEIATLVGIGAGYSLGGRFWELLALNAFRAAAGLYLLSALAVWIWVSHTRQVRQVQRTSLAGYLAVIRQPRILRFAPAWLCVTAVIGLWFNNIIFQLAGPRHPGQLLTGGMTGSQVSTIMGLFVLVLIAGTFGWSRLFGRIPDKTSIMAIALGGMFVVCFDLLLLNHRGDNSRWWFVALLPILAVAVAIESGFTPAALAYLADITEDFRADRGVIMGLYSIFLSVGEVTGGVAGGPFAQAWGLDGMIFLTVILAAAATITVVLLRRADARFP